VLCVCSVAALVVSVSADQLLQRAGQLVTSTIEESSKVWRRICACAVVDDTARLLIVLRDCSSDAKAL
jgi:hypothetical protein